MTRYSVKRGRRIKKYKKSRKGCGRRGRRSIRRCKTRKSKIFMKTTRNNVSNRRKMSGGFNFEITMEQAKTHILRKYSKSFQLLGIPPGSQLELTLMGYGHVYISKKSVFAEDFSLEQVVAVRCDIQTGDEELTKGKYYAIVRCATYENTRSCPNGKGIWETVLFVKKGEVTAMNYQEQLYLKNPVINKRKNDTSYGTDSDIYKFFTEHKWFNFKNSISSNAEYDIFVENNPSSSTLIKFFDFLSPTNLSEDDYVPGIDFDTMKTEVDAQARSYIEEVAARELRDNAKRPAAQSNKASGAVPWYVSF